MPLRIRVNIDVDQIDALTDDEIIILIDDGKLEGFYPGVLIDAQGHDEACTDVYEAYSRWAASVGKENALTKTFLNRELTRLGVEKKRKRDKFYLLNVALVP